MTDVRVTGKAPGDNHRRAERMSRLIFVYYLVSAKKPARAMGQGSGRFGADDALRPS